MFFEILTRGYIGSCPAKSRGAFCFCEKILRYLLRKQKKRIIFVLSLTKKRTTMEVTTTFTWERSPGEEVALEIGGEYTSAGVLTEFDQPHSDSVSFDWFNDGHNTYLASTVNFQPHELDAMQTALLEAARRKYPATAKAQFPGLRGLLGLVDPPQKEFVI